MDPWDVGRMRCCPACGRPLVEEFDIGLGDPGPEDFRCSCCDRPSNACPCTLATEGACRSIREIATGYGRIGHEHTPS